MRPSIFKGKMVAYTPTLVPPGKLKCGKTVHGNMMGSVGYEWVHPKIVYLDSPLFWDSIVYPMVIKHGNGSFIIYH